jgi:hypothetical protein
MIDLTRSQEHTLQLAKNAEVSDCLDRGRQGALIDLDGRTPSRLQPTHAGK